MNKSLTTEQLAALAAGASLDEILAVSASEPGESEQDKALALELASVQAALTVAQEDLAVVKADAATAKEQADAKLAEVSAQLAEVQAASDEMSSVIEARIKNMSVALSSAVPDKAATAKELVAQHSELETKFKASFKVGAPTKKVVEPAAKPLFTEAQLAAAKLIPVL